MEWNKAKTNRVLPRKCIGHSKHPLPATQEKTTHGHHQMVNTEIRLIIFFAAKDGEALNSQQKQDQELTGSDHDLLITKFRLKLKKVGKTAKPFSSVQFSSVQPLSHVWHFTTPWTAAHQASLSITSSQSLLKLMSIKSVMPSNHLILCHPLLLPPSIFSSIRVFSNESVLHIRWPKYWSFSFSISHSNEYSGLISFRMD